MRARTPLRAWIAAGGLAAIVTGANICSPLWAQTTGSRIAYVDMTRVIAESELFANGRARLTREFTPRNQAFSLEEARLRDLEARRERDSAELSSVEIADLKREIETLARSIARQKNDLNNALNRRLSEVRESIDRRIREEIGAYARSEGIDLVLTDGVGFADPKLDITDAVLERVNSRADEVNAP